MLSSLQFFFSIEVLAARSRPVFEWAKEALPLPFGITVFPPKNDKVVNTAKNSTCHAVRMVASPALPAASKGCNSSWNTHPRSASSPLKRNPEAGDCRWGRPFHNRMQCSAVCLHLPAVGGLNEVKRKLQQSVEWPLRYPEHFARLGLKPYTGLLLYGPPGCAKTSLMRALAAATHSTIISVDSAKVLDSVLAHELAASVHHHVACSLFNALWTRIGHGRYQDNRLSPVMSLWWPRLALQKCQNALKLGRLGTENGCKMDRKHLFPIITRPRFSNCLYVRRADLPQ